MVGDAGVPDAGDAGAPEPGKATETSGCRPLPDVVGVGRRGAGRVGEGVMSTTWART